MAKTKKELNAHRRELYAKNKEQRKLQDKKYYANNRKQILAKKKTYRKKNSKKISVKGKEYLVQNRNKIHFTLKQYYMTHKKQAKERTRIGNLRRYGLTPELYNDMFTLQGGKCLICGTHQSDLSRALHVDHDHITGKVRGLLCYSCNTLLGHAHDNLERLQKAIEYIVKNK